MRFARAASVMYGGTLPSPCFAKPHFCVQPRKPRQRGGRRAGGLEKKRDIWDFHGCPKYRVFLYYKVMFFVGCAVLGVNFFAWEAFFVPMSMGKSECA